MGFGLLRKYLPLMLTKIVLKLGNVQTSEFFRHIVFQSVVENKCSEGVPKYIFSIHDTEVTEVGILAYSLAKIWTFNLMVPMWKILETQIFALPILYC